MVLRGPGSQAVQSGASPRHLSRYRGDGVIDEPKTRKWAWIGWTVLALFVLYPLSFGPSIWIVANSDSGQLLHAHCFIFAPLRWARDRSDTIDSAFECYTRVWVPEE
jgi:hypothetical protein